MNVTRTRRTTRHNTVERSDNADKAYHVRSQMLELVTEAEWASLDRMAEPQGDRAFWENCEIGALANCIQRARGTGTVVKMTVAERRIMFGSTGE